MNINKLFFIFLIVFFYNITLLKADNFFYWLNSFKLMAIDSGISKTTVNNVMDEAIFLPKVIKYDRYQPEFYEDTKTYIKKRANKKKVAQAINLFKEENLKINEIEKKFSVEKELLLSLMGIETNYGKYLGKMDIVSSLATLSYDKRRRDFFTKELLILLKLVDNNVIDRSSLYGSWAGAFGNFQFMPRTIRDYAIDYNLNDKIELKNIDDSFASAANYINKIGWKNNQPCFIKINLNKNIPKKYLNTSAKKIINKKKLKFFKNYIKNFDEIKTNNNTIVGIITPDKDIIPGADNLNPAYLVFANYELILKWNRSLRFALAVCTLKEKISNEL